MLCVEDYVDALEWAAALGGAKALQARADANAETLAAWVRETPWIDFLAVDPPTRSNTSVCLVLAEAGIEGSSEESRAALAKAMAAKLNEEGVAYDIGSYRDAPAGLRIWCGSTVEQSDVAALLPWLEWAFETARAEAG
jgi:phosphoserine aminotransferase